MFQVVNPTPSAEKRRLLWTFFVLGKGWELKNLIYCQEREHKATHCAADGQASFTWTGGHYHACCCCASKHPSSWGRDAASRLICINQGVSFFHYHTQHLRQLVIDAFARVFDRQGVRGFHVLLETSLIFSTAGHLHWGWFIDDEKFSIWNRERCWSEEVVALFLKQY